MHPPLMLQFFGTLLLPRVMQDKQHRAESCSESVWTRAVRREMASNDVSLLDGQRRDIDDINPCPCLILTVTKSRVMMHNHDVCLRQKHLHSLADAHLPPAVLLRDDDTANPVTPSGSHTIWHFVLLGSPATVLFFLACPPGGFLLTTKSPKSCLLPPLFQGDPPIFCSTVPI